MAMNVGLDLAAADMPLRPDPAVRTRRRPATVGRAAFESVLQDEGDDYNRALRAYVSELIASGMDPETANRVAVSRMVQNRMENIPEGAVADERTAAVGSGVELGINDPGALDLGGAGRPGPYDLAGRPGYDRTFTPQELASQRDAPEPVRGYQRVPAPRIPYGGPVPEPGVITDPEAIEAYTTRPWDDRRHTYNPSEKDRDMSARGLVPVLNEDGSVGYSVGYPQGSIAGENANRFPGAAGRSGERQDLTDAGWKTETVPSPLGRQTVYRPGERQAQQIEGVDKRRLARRAGIPSAQAQGMSIDQLRLAAQGAADDEAIDRKRAWKAQTMLAGGQPTGGRGGTKAITNALEMLPEDERNQSLRYMLPGGQLAAAVDAQNMQNANDVIKRFMTSGAAAGMNNPLAAAQAQAAQQQVDAAKPVQVRAQEHVAAGQLNHPDVFQHADDIVNTHYSSRPGMLGVSSRFTDNEVMLGAQRLADDTGMPIAEAEKIMRRVQADRNRNSVASSIVAGFYDQ